MRTRTQILDHINHYRCRRSAAIGTLNELVLHGGGEGNIVTLVRDIAAYASAIDTLVWVLEDGK